MLVFKTQPYYLLIVALFFFSCQKELDESGYRTCVIKEIKIFEQTSTTPVESYVYEYDPVTRWPTAINISVPSIPFSRRILVSINDRDINLGPTGSIKIDGSRRITELLIRDPVPGADEGGFFYGYNNAGFLQDRLYDDGVSELERTEFENNGSALTGFDISYANAPPVATGSITYLTAPNIGTDVLLPYADVLPELLPFFPLIQLGRLGNLPLSQLVFQVTGTALTLTYNYSNYQLNSEGSLIGFENAVTLPGLPALKRRYQFAYDCQ
jgi:hypothetical protein